MGIYLAGVLAAALLLVTSTIFDRTPRPVLRGARTVGLGAALSWVTVAIFICVGFQLAVGAVHRRRGPQVIDPDRGSAR